jgi:hypothetical protein
MCQSVPHWRTVPQRLGNLKDLGKIDPMKRRSRQKQRESTKISPFARLEARGLGSISINLRITAVRKLAVEAPDNGLLAPELAAGITRKGPSHAVSIRK